jgi:hypothetical protein
LDNFINGFSVLLNLDIYLIVFLGIIIYLPYVLVSQGIVFSLLNEDISRNKLLNLLNTYSVGLSLQVLSETFIYANFISVVLFQNDFNFMFLFDLAYNDFDSFFLLMVATLIILVFVSATELEFLVGVVLAGILGAGAFFPPLPDFFTILWILLAAFLTSYIGPILTVYPVTKIFGDYKRFKEYRNIDPDLYQQNIFEVIIIQYFQKILILIPVAVYISWLSSA